MANRVISTMLLQAEETAQTTVDIFAGMEKSSRRRVD